MEQFNKTRDRQTMLTEAPRDSNDFGLELCETFMAADIPLEKLNNPALRSFLQKLAKKEIPSVTTLRRRHVDAAYTNTRKKILSDLASSPIWIGVDETTDFTGRYIAHLIVGALREEPSTPHLVASKVLAAGNNTTITNFVNDSLHALWPEKLVKENVLLLLTDSVNYMKKSGSTLSVMYSNLIHVTCIAHALHLLAEEIRRNFSDVDSLISNKKKVFVKAPNRVLKYRELCPTLELPPKPVLTRWGTWLDAVKFFCDNFEAVKAVVDTFDPIDAKCIDDAQAVFKHDAIKCSLAFINTNYVFLSASIKQLETRNLLLADAVGIVEAVASKLRTVEGPIGKRVIEKFEYVLDKNKGFKEISNISHILSGHIGQFQTAKSLSPAQLCSFKFAPIVTCEVERSFSRFKSIFKDNRTRFTEENLEKFIVVNCNAET